VISLARTWVTGKGQVCTHGDKVFNPVLRKDGYLQVRLCKDGKVKAFSIHRLIALTCIPNPNNLPYVCHKDDDPTNNHPDNLFWGTAKDNHDDSYSKKRSYMPKRAVFSHSPDGNVYWYESASEAQRQTGIHQADISRCCLGKAKTAGGFIWKYATP
jgi:hypothetical protein